jgi:hypothetical protein
MRYAEIAESETDSRTQREKLASARDKVSKAAQTNQSAVKTAHTRATAAQRKAGYAHASSEAANRDFPPQAVPSGADCWG